MTTSLVARRALDLILRFQDVSGAYPASPTFSAYRGFSWFRDGAFIADAVSAAGEPASAAAFHDWCSRALTGWRPRVDSIVDAVGNGRVVPESQMLPARLRLDGSEEHGDWADFQVDGLGTWLWALDEHTRRHGNDSGRWLPAVEVTVDYLTAVGDSACYDWWEERPPGRHPSTWGCVIAGLSRAAAMSGLDPTRRRLADRTAERMRAEVIADARKRGYVGKSLGSDVVDASAISLVAPLGVLGPDEPLARSTLEEIERQLVVGNGTHRFLGDRYFGGGRWPLLSAMLGLAWLRLGETDRARELWEWSARAEDAEGNIPEQVGDRLLVPSGLDEWNERWGPSASPLLWSSAMVLRLAVELDV